MTKSALFVSGGLLASAVVLGWTLQAETVSFARPPQDPGVRGRTAGGDNPPPGPSRTRPGGPASIARGRILFTEVGCANCHSAAAPGQGSAAPLRGLGQRVFFLHDGRTTDLVDAIRAHARRGAGDDGVVVRYGALADAQKQDLLNFLRSL
ncbi:MAG: c-type cytochrome [Vicinamibacterales bacterium]